MVEPLEERRLCSVTLIHEGLDTSNTYTTYTTDTVEYHGELYSLGWDADHGAELWKSNGTPQSSSLVSDITVGAASSQISSIQVLNDLIYFTVDRTYFSESNRELWRSDGTDNGTFKLLAYNVTPDAQFPLVSDSAVRASLRPVQAGNKVFFAALENREGPLWMTDGTVEGTEPAAPGFISNYGFYDNAVDSMVSFGGAVYFTLRYSQYTEVRLIKTDGTEQGTSYVYDFDSPYSDAYVTHSFGALTSAGLKVAGGHLYLESAYWELWRSEGTPDTTQPLTFKLDGTASVALNLPAKPLFVPFQDKLLAYDRTLGWFLTDGTTATRLPSVGGMVSTDADSIYFTKMTSSPKAIQFWRSDGTPSGNTLLAVVPNDPARIYPYTGAKFFAERDGVVYFKVLYGSDAAGQSEIWAVGDAPENATQLDTVGPGNPVLLNDKLYFSGARHDESGESQGIGLYSLDPGSSVVRGVVHNPYGTTDDQRNASGFTLFLDSDGDGELDGGEHSTVVNARGEFFLNDVPPGQYVLGLIGPSDAWQFIDSPLTGPPVSKPIKVGVEVEADHTTVLALQTVDTSPAIVAGTVFRDSNGNRNPDAHEGKSLIVFDDANSNEQLDAGEVWARSDAAGHYQLILFSAGNRPIRIVPIKGWDVGQFAYRSPIFATPGQTVAANLAVAKMETETGIIFDDRNGDGKQQSNEPGIAGVPVRITAYRVSGISNDRNELKQWKVVTDKKGHYQFGGVPIFPPDGNQLISVSVAPEPIKGKRFVQSIFDSHKTTDGVTVNSNFGSTATVLLIGAVYQGFGIGRGESDPWWKLLKGWTIYIDKNSNARLDSGEQRVLTEGAGWYEFAPMPAGTYMVRVIMRKGFKPVSAVLETLTLKSGAIDSVDFQIDKSK